MKKLISLLLVFALFSTTLVYGEESTIKDIGNHWGKGYITQLIDRGGITGYTDGTFRPDNTITTAEFMTIAVRSALNGNVAESNGGHWASGIFESARQEGVLLLNDFPKSTWDKPINRYDMAYILVRVTENIKGESQIGTSDVAKIMSDYGVVSQTRYQYYVEQAFMKGLVTGKTQDGKYDGVANGTRAEAATMVVRMLEETNRVEVDTTITTPSDTVRRIDLTDPNRPLIPKEGDIVINSKGEEVTLKKGPAGVLGEGQGIDYYSGITFEATGYIFREGSLGTKRMGYDGQTYLIDERTGEGHFREDWNIIRGYYIRTAFEKYGHTQPEGTTYGEFAIYDGTMWGARVPSNLAD